MISVNTRLLALISILAIAVLLSVFFLLPPGDSSIDDDKDGFMNDEDFFPKDSSEWNDSDSDGVGDNKDKFPFDPSASIDTDDDGYPDKWNEGKNANDSTSIPPLIRDDLPFNPKEFQDSDGDGYGDNIDLFPNDETEWSDDDLDGVGGNTDVNPIVNLSFQLTIESCLLTRHVDLLPWAQVYFEITVNDDPPLTFDNNGNYWRIWKNNQASIDINLQYDIPDSIANKFTDIEIAMIDHDLFLDDDPIDISSVGGRSSVLLRINHQSNTVENTGISEGDKGKIWYTITLAQPVQSSNLTIDKSYQFSYNNTEYEISLSIPRQKYEWYQNLSTNRSPQRLSDKQLMTEFVTSDDEVIDQLADQLFSIANAEGFSTIETINFVLSYVQYAVPYGDDVATAGCVEYWRYPIETLVDGTGDCEDSTVLFASIVKNKNIDVVLLFYVLDEENGHLASAVKLSNEHDGVAVEYQNAMFYYVETTDIGFRIGEKPLDIPDDPELIIPID